MSPLVFGILLFVSTVHVHGGIIAKHERQTRQIGNWPSFPDWITQNTVAPSRRTTSRTARPQEPSEPANGNGVGCGVQAPNLQPNLGKKVINGQEAKPHSWPWAVGLISTSIQGKFLCGASLLRVRDDIEESDIVLTAAHCVAQRQSTQPVSASTLSVAAGRHRHNAPGQYNQQRRASSIRMHPQYTINEALISNDIAVVKLDSPIKFNEAIRPLCLPQQGAEIPVDQTCVVAGWGRNNSNNHHESPEALHQLVLPVHPASTCSKSWGSRYKQETMICAGSLKGESGACHGDSGSMLACKQGGRWVQHGVTSWGDGDRCTVPNKPGVFARVPTYVDWIKQSILSLTSVKRRS